jgi:hypothetical protein
VIFCLIKQRAVDLLSDGALLPSNALFFSLARMILEHMFARSIKLAGASNWQSRNNVLMALTYPLTVAD